MSEAQSTKKTMSPLQIVFFVLALVFVGFVLMVPVGQRPVAPTVSSLVNSPAPDFKLNDIDGNPWHLESLKGKVVVVNFWATWCPTCRDEMPSLNKLFELKSGPSGGLKILTVLSQDNPENARSYFKEAGFSMPVLLDPDSATAYRYRITGVPETFIVDKSGVIIKHFLGPVEFGSPEALAYFDSLIAQ